MTFSIVGRCSKTGDLGIAVSTARIAVGSRVPFVRSRVGAIAIMADTNVLLGYEGLRLLKEGEDASSALEKVLKIDENRERRQLTIIDHFGNKAAFTGKDTVEYKGHLIGTDCVVAGNMLVGPETLEVMLNTFEDTIGSLGERLLKALTEGQNAGGDKRGRVSAALIVINAYNIHPVLNLRVDEHCDPVKELGRIFDKYQDFLKNN